MEGVGGPLSQRMKERKGSTGAPWYLHVVFEADGGAHDIGGPTEDFKRKEVVWAGFGEVTLDLHDLWGGNRPVLVAAAVCRTTQNSFLGFLSQPQPQPQAHTVPPSAVSVWGAMPEAP